MCSCVCMYKTWCVVCKYAHIAYMYASEHAMYAYVCVSKRMWALYALCVCVCVHVFIRLHACHVCVSTHAHAHMWEIVLNTVLKLQNLL